MLSFLEFIQEAIISRKKTLDKIKNYPERISTDKVVPNAEYKHIYPSYDNIESAPIKNVPIHTIITSQTYVNKYVVSKKIEGTWRAHNPRFPLFIKLKSGNHYLMDGNHRVTSRALRGFTHIRGRVLEIDESLTEAKKGDKLTTKQKVRNVILAGAIGIAGTSGNTNIERIRKLVKGHQTITRMRRRPSKSLKRNETIKKLERPEDPKAYPEEIKAYKKKEQ